jgi:hypothetical protein
MHLSAYGSTEYNNKNKKLKMEDIALLAYGNIVPHYSYFAEIENSIISTYHLNTNTSVHHRTTHIERLYLDYTLSQTYNIRIGKQITPIGYWNYQPINVLRDTTSNPIYSTNVFPKLFSGIDLYGDIKANNHLNYHIFIQANKNLDEHALNIENNLFYGISLNYALNNTSIGGSLSQYKTKNTNYRVNIFQFNAKYATDTAEVQTEFAYKTVTNSSPNIDAYTLIGYIQGKYSINEKHALISRYEYINHAHISIFGYSYRPIYPISLKAEYQFHSNKIQNKMLMSFSILF